MELGMNLEIDIWEIDRTEIIMKHKLGESFECLFKTWYPNFVSHYLLFWVTLPGFMAAVLLFCGGLPHIPFLSQ